MQNTPPLPELESLRKEIRELREELHLLRSFIRVEPGPSNGARPHAHLRCSSIEVSSAEGPASLHLSPGKVTVSAREGERAVELSADEDSGRGSVLVSDRGRPRAVLKATPDGGCVSVLHDDGRPRGSLLSTRHDGADLLLITPDLKPGVRISSGAPEGGLVSVHRTNGAPAVALMCGKTAAGMSLRSADGRTRIIT